MSTASTGQTLRVATAADADALSAFGRGAFTDAFAADNRPEDLLAYLDSAFSPEIQRRELQNPSSLCLLMERDGTLIAYATLRFDTVSPFVDDPSAIEIQRFYVDRSGHGTGLAQTLMSACIDVAERRGAGTLFLGVWQINAKALRFYGKQGFQVVGEQMFRMGTDEQGDFVMARPLR